MFMDFFTDNFLPGGFHLKDNKLSCARLENAVLENADVRGVPPKEQLLREAVKNNNMREVEELLDAHRYSDKCINSILAKEGATMRLKMLKILMGGHFNEW